MSDTELNPRERDRNYNVPITGRQAVNGVRNHQGFPISDGLRTLVAGVRSFDLMKFTSNQTMAQSIKVYNKYNVERKVTEVDESGEVVETTTYIPRIDYYDAAGYMRYLARTPGSVAKKALQIQQDRYRQGWGLINSKYLQETDGEVQSREDRAAGRQSVVLWETQLKVHKKIDDRGTQIKLQDPVYRDWQARYNQRERVIRYVDDTIRNVALAAHDIRTTNKSFRWHEESGPFQISIDANQFLDRAVSLFHGGVEESLTRYTDANEQSLVMEAVVYDLYHNPHQLSVMDVLMYLHRHMQKQPPGTTGGNKAELLALVQDFNARESRLICENASNGWQRMRHYVHCHHAVSSRAAQLNLVNWWRELAFNAAWVAPTGWRFLDELFALTCTDCADTIFSLPEGYDAGDWEAMDPTVRWPLVPLEQRNAFKQFQIDAATKEADKEARSAEAKKRRELCASAAEKRAEQMESLDNRITTETMHKASEFASLAFKNPGVIENANREVYISENPQYKKDLEVQERQKKERAEKRKAKAPMQTAKKAKNKPQSVNPSPAGPSDNDHAIMVDDSDEEGFEKYVSTCEARERMNRISSRPAPDSSDDEA